MGVEPIGQISADNSLAVYNFVRAGAGIAIVPPFLIIDDAKHQDVQHILLDWQIKALDVFAESPKNAPKDGIVRLFVTELRHALNELK